MNGLELSSATTASKAWAEVARIFRLAKLESPVIDSRLLVCHVLGTDRLGLLRDPNRPLGDLVMALQTAAGRRLANEPVSRIIGQRAFFGRWFAITPSTLDPRADSETLVAAALELAAPIQAARGSEPLRVLDLGTGTGCLLLTLLAELPGSTGVGVDVSEAALAVARDNAERLGLADRARIIAGDWAAGLDGPFDLIVSNPPYIRQGDLAALPPDVLAYDPMSALDGGADGLVAYRQILAGLPPLSANGALLFEVGLGQADAVQNMMHDAFGSIPGVTLHRWRDLSDIERVVGLAT